MYLIMRFSIFLHPRQGAEESAISPGDSLDALVVGKISPTLALFALE